MHLPGFLTLSSVFSSTTIILIILFLYVILQPCFWTSCCDSPWMVDALPSLEALDSRLLGSWQFSLLYCLRWGWMTSLEPIQQRTCKEHQT